VILLDAQALVALLADEPGAGEVGEILRSSGAAMTSVNVAEAIDISERKLGIEPQIVDTAIATLRVAALHVLACGEDDAWRAGELRARRYHHRRSPISIADAFLVAAGSAGDAVATADAGVIHVARAEGLDVIPLPDSTGRRPR